MLRVTIELLPFGREEGKQTLGIVELTNDGSGDRHTGNYDVRLSKSLVGLHTQTWKRGRVLNFPRLKLGPYDLLYRALRETVGGRNRE